MDVLGILAAVGTIALFVTYAVVPRLRPAGWGRYVATIAAAAAFTILLVGAVTLI
jgi:hypothetical protein